MANKHKNGGKGGNPQRKAGNNPGKPASQQKVAGGRVSADGKGRKGGSAPGGRRAAGVAGRTALGAERLYRKTDDLHKQASELHNSIHKAHLTAQRLHNQIHERIPGVSPLAGGLEGDLGQEGEFVVTVDQEKREYGKPFPVVGIGASAGGFEALNQFLAALPRDTGMAFVIVQHLDPSHESQLTELLRRGAHLSVQEIRNNTDVESNRIYVMPPNTSLKISGGKLPLSKRQRAEIPQMPVDRFFRSLAEDQLDLAIGVVLSGSGSDGTLGIEAIKGQGGVTFAQNEASSKYFGMPGSAIAAGAT